VADSKISDLTALTTPATGDLIPIVDISEAAAADKNKSITVGELLRGAPDGTAAAPGIAFESDGGNGMFLGGTDILAFSTGGSQAVTIDASQRVGIGTSSPGSLNSAANQLVVGGGSGNQGVTIYTGNGVGDQGSIFFADGTTGGSQQAAGYIYYRHDTDSMALGTANTVRLTIDSSGRVGIGTTSPAKTLHVNGDIRLPANNTISWGDDACRIFRATDDLRIDVGGSERARIDSSGRLLLGTSTALANIKRYATSTAPQQQISTAVNSWSSGLGLVNYSGSGYAPVLTLGLSRSNTKGTNALVTSGNRLGVITFNGNDGTNFEEGARIEVQADGTPSSTSMPGRLMFFTTPNGTSTPRERMRINHSGDFDFSGNGSNYGLIYGGFGAKTTGGTANWNDSTNARSGQGYTLLLGTATNGPGGSVYFHPFCFEYSNKDGTGNLTQLAIGYNTNARYMRYRTGSTWSSWVSF
jgi:hypothetical protein